MVYDASDKEREDKLSLKDCLQPAQPLQNFLWTVLVRSQIYRIAAITAWGFAESISADPDSKSRVWCFEILLTTTWTIGHWNLSFHSSPFWLDLFPISVGWCHQPTHHTMGRSVSRVRWRSTKESVCQRLAVGGCYCWRGTNEEVEGIENLRRRNVLFPQGAQQWEKVRKQWWSERRSWRGLVRQTTVGYHIIRN